jgi:F0F1-type ATP synthase assembly protein I
MANQTDSVVRGANESLQANLDRGKPVIFASYGIVGAILLFGGLGYVMDKWLRTAPWFFLAGIVVGLCMASYALIAAARRREAS